MKYILQTFVVYRPDIGYMQGMSYLAAQLLTTLTDPRHAFVAFANLLCTRYAYLKCLKTHSQREYAQYAPIDYLASSFHHLAFAVFSILCCGLFGAGLQHTVACTW